MYMISKEYNFLAYEASLHSFSIPSSIFHPNLVVVVVGKALLLQYSPSTFDILQ